jgi:hypothetical protein
MRFRRRVACTLAGAGRVNEFETNGSITKAG